MKKWEYRILVEQGIKGSEKSLAEELEGTLNKLGKEGWRVVPITVSLKTDALAMMEREIPEPQTPAKP